MDIQILSSENELGQVASQAGASIIRSAISENGIANIILATGTSQLATLKYLVREKAVEWSKVVMFHLDEYVGISNKAPASFCKYIQDRFLSKLPPLHATYLINGQAETVGECRRLKKLIQKCPIDLAFVGIGENGHLAFNDPPANFVTKEPFLVVQLDEACRKQQLSEGWFSKFDEVPTQAISMSIHQIMLSKQIICSVPQARKATAVFKCLFGGVSNLWPASILREHQNCLCLLDNYSASLLAV